MFWNKKEVGASIQHEPASNVLDVTEHLEILKKKSKENVTKISTTLSLIENLTDEAQCYQKKLSTERDIWKATFDAITCFIMVIDNDFKVTRVNSALRNYLGIHEQFILGKSCTEILNGNFCNCISTEINYGITKKNCPLKNGHVISDDFTTVELDNKYFTISYSPIKGINQNTKGHVLLFYDITETVVASRTLKNRDAIMTAINDASVTMLKEYQLSHEVRIQDMIEKIGKSINVDRVYISKNIFRDNIPISAKRLYEWCADDIEPHISKGMFLYEQFYRWTHIMDDGGSIHGHVKNFPESEKIELSKYNVKSLLEIPLFVFGKFFGFMGFDRCIKEKTWEEPEINALYTSATIIGTWIERIQIEKSFKDLMNKTFKKKRLGTYLIEEGILSEKKLDEILNKQENENINKKEIV